MHELFRQVSVQANRFSGAPSGFAAALAVILVWALTGPIFHFSDTWQLVINTSTTIVTFLLAFLINGSQNVSQARMEALEQKIDDHVITTAKAHTDELRANTELTREIHRLVSAKRGANGRFSKAG